MFRLYKYTCMSGAGFQRSSVALAAWLLFSGVVAAQNQSAATSSPDLSPPAATIGMPLRVTFPLVPGVKVNNAVPSAGSLGGQADGGGSFALNASGASVRVRRITLEEAKQMAAGANNPLVRLGQLQVEAAKQHRLGVQGLYFPNIGSQVENTHLNKATGQVFGSRLGVEIPINIFHKNNTVFNISAAQPVTPLFAIYQMVKIARADENIARAKAGMPVAEVASKVEKNFFDLLVAERELTSAEAEAKKVQAKWLTASSSGVPMASTEEETETIGAEKAVVLSTSKVKELSESLNEILSLPEGTMLDLVPPEPLVEDISLQEATEKASAANPEVIEAEQTAVKAHAGEKLSKMTYFPSVAITGGYANQSLVSNLVLPHDFGYIGVIGTFTLFDGFKREHGVKEVSAQAEMADLAVQLTKAKVAAGVKNSYFELDRSRQLSQLARRMVSGAQVLNASYQPGTPEVEAARAKMEADMFRAELEYRQAYARLKSLMGDN
jgi:outer membrane protein TolC